MQHQFQYLHALEIDSWFHEPWHSLQHYKQPKFSDAPKIEHGARQPEYLRFHPTEKQPPPKLLDLELFCDSDIHWQSQPV